MSQTMRYLDDMGEIFNQLDLTPQQRFILCERYRFLLNDYRARCRIYAALFYVFRITMTVGSLAVPALLSIQNTPGTSNTVYWLAWAVSLAVTTANGITTLFRLDKRYFMLYATAERLRSETWQYVQLSGRYSGHHGRKKPTHSNQFVFYCSQLEKINMKRVNDEFIRTSEDVHTYNLQPLQPGQKLNSDTLVPSPPDLETPATGNRRDSLSVVEVDESEDAKAKGADSITEASVEETNGTHRQGSVLTLQMHNKGSPMSPPSNP